MTCRTQRSPIGRASRGETALWSNPPTAVRWLLGCAAVSTMALSACGGDEAPTGDGAGNEADLVVEVDGLKLDADNYATTAGDVTIEYVNDGSVPHTLVVDGIDGFSLSVGDTDSGSVRLEPGSYTLFCDVPGHREAGMQATLTVK